MVPDTLLLFASIIIVQGQGIADDQKMHFVQPLSPKLQLGTVQIKRPMVKTPHETNFQTIKGMHPSFQNYNLENRTSQEIILNKLRGRLNSFEHKPSEHYGKGLLYNLKQNISSPIKKLSSTEKNIVMNQADLILQRNNSIQIESTTNIAFTLGKIKKVQKLFEHKRGDFTANVKTYTFSNITGDINGDSVENSSFRPPTNVIKDSKKISIISHPDEKSSLNNGINKSRSYGSKFLNLHVQQPSNVSWVDKSEFYVGKYSQDILEVDRDYMKRFNKSTSEEGKLNKKYEELPSSENISKSNLISSKVTKINDFTKAKQVMIGYFESFNIKQVNAVRNGTISVYDTIMSSQNMFELMEKSSKLIKEILEAKRADEEEPFYFMKNMAQKQVEKCNGNYSFSMSNVNGTTPTRVKIENNERLMDFIKCVNVNLQNCILNFYMWLRTKKYYLRPHFNFTRAYKSFVRLHFLNCG